MKKELQYQALPKLQLLPHLTTTTIFTTHCRCCCSSLPVCMSVCLFVCLCLPPESKGGSFSAHKLFNKLKMEKNKKQKTKKRVQEKHNNNYSSNNRSKTKGLFKTTKYCNDWSVVLNKKLRPKNSTSPRQVQAS